MTWTRDIDRWYIDEVLPHEAAYRAKVASLCGPEHVDDLVQEAYARVIALDNYRTIASPRAYTLTIVHNLAIERLRRARIVRIDQFASIEALPIADPAPDAFDHVAGRSELARLMKALDALPPQCRRVVSLRKFEGVPPLAIAEMLSISVSTVEKHLGKGLALLTRAMRDHGEETGTTWRNRLTERRKDRS